MCAHKFVIFFFLEEFMAFKNVQLFSSDVRTRRDPKGCYFIDVDTIAQRVHLRKAAQLVRCRGYSDNAFLILFFSHYVVWCCLQGHLVYKLKASTSIDFDRKKCPNIICFCYVATKTKKLQNKSFKMSDTYFLKISMWRVWETFSFLFFFFL